LSDRSLTRQAKKAGKKAKMDSHKYIKTKNTSAISRFEIKRL